MRRHGDLGEDDTSIATVASTAPAADYVLVTGEATISSEDDTSGIDAYLVSDGTTRRWTYWGGGDGYVDQTNTMSVVVPVTAGAHTFGLTVSEHDATTRGGPLASAGDRAVLRVGRCGHPALDRAAGLTDAGAMAPPGHAGGGGSGAAWGDRAPRLPKDLS
jgi:hypothetical protein